MVAYVIGVLPLIKLLKEAYPDVIQPWYIENAVALGTFDNIGLYFNSFKLFALVREYYPKTLKIVLITHLDNIVARKYIGLSHGFQVCMSARYLGGFIGDD